MTLGEESWHLFCEAKNVQTLDPISSKFSEKHVSEVVFCVRDLEVYEIRQWTQQASYIFSIFTSFWHCSFWTRVVVLVSLSHFHSRFCQSFLVSQLVHWSGLWNAKRKHKPLKTSASTRRETKHSCRSHGQTHTEVSSGNKTCVVFRNSVSVTKTERDCSKQ